MSTRDGHDLERLRYWQGQTLRSRDFRDQARLDARRRQLHNRALHPGAGIALGLAVGKVDGDPSTLRVGCGLAVDCRGRQLMLQQARDVAVPSAPSWLFLRSGAADSGQRCGCESGEPGCEPPSVSMADRDVELVWAPLDSLAWPDGVVLARYVEDLDPAFQAPRIRPLARPRLARGKTVRGNTPWEPWAVEQPDGQGGVATRVVGVQTRIDTSAAGFTRIPVYQASVDAPAWDLATAEFAPAFFPHVADPSIDGFTFRLLMVETTRRRYGAASGVARVTTTSRGVGDALQVTVDDAASFQKGDMVALLRPRARTIVGARPGTGAAVLLGAPLDDVTAGETSVAIGNLPRLARVTNATPEAALAVADFTATPAIKKGDVLRRASDGATAVIASVSVAKKQLKVKNPFANWMPADEVHVARLGRAVAVSTVQPGGVGLVLTPATHAVTKDLVVVAVDDDGTPLGGARTVIDHAGAGIEVRPALAASEIVRVAKVAVFAADVTIGDVTVTSPGLEVELTTSAPFAEGDLVAVAGNPSAIAAVRRVPTAKTLELDAPIRVVKGDDLVAANWLGAATVVTVVPGPPAAITIGRSGAVPAGAFVVRRLSDDSFSVPAVVDVVSGATLTLRTAIPDLARLDTIAIGSFPRVVNVLAQQADETQIQILAAQAGMLAAGDEVALAGAASSRVAQVVAANGNTVALSDSLGPLAVGQALAVVHFRDRARVTRVVSSTSIEIAPDVDLRREGDVVGVLTHYVDASNPGYVDRIEGGNRLVLVPPSIQAGDGIVDLGWIDGGVIGQASLAVSPTDPSPEWRFQPFLRLLTTEGLGRFEPALIYGLDLLSGRFLVSAVVPFILGTGDHVFVLSSDPGQRFRYRPETLSLVTTFNTDFPRAFATFAQKQRLAVSWIACQEPFPRPAGCPGREPFDPCADAD